MPGQRNDARAAPSNGDLTPASSSARRQRQMSVAAASRFVENALALRTEDAQTANSVGFMARMLVSATMPHSKTDAAKFSRTNGHITVSMLADPEIGLPYGTYPRLIMCWLTTEAVRTRSPTLELGDSLSAFMRDVGLEVRGGHRGTITALRSHLQRLLSTTISWRYQTDSMDAGGRVAPVEQHCLWWDPRRPDQIGLWKSTLTLNQRFFEAIIERPVPIDIRALQRLAKTKSSLALDIYTWLTHRMRYLKGEQFIPWQSLQLQFGGDYGRAIDFQRKFAQRLNLVLQLYPEARVHKSESGLILHESPSHVPSRRRLVSP